MRRRVQIALLSFLLTSSAATAAGGRELALPLPAGPARLEASRPRAGSLRLAAAVGELVLAEVETPHGTFTRVEIPGRQRWQEVGRPGLPLFCRLLALPPGVTVDVEIVPGPTRTVDLRALGLDHPLLPVQPGRAKRPDAAAPPFRLDAGTYAAAEVGRETVRLVPLGRLRDVDVVRLEISPVRWLPAAGTLEVVESLEVRLVRRDGGGDVGIAPPRDPVFAPLYARLEPLGEAAAAGKAAAGPVHLALVTPPEFAAQLAPYVASKTERGFLVTVGVLGEPDVGTTAASIQAWVHGLYTGATPAAPAPSYLVLVGDIAQCPTFSVGGHATDRPYAAVDGDVLPDMLYGRLSATDATQLQAILDKTLAWDRLDLPDLSYLGRAVLVAGMDAGHGATWGNGQVSYGTSQYFNPAHGLDCDAFLYPESGEQAAAIIAAVDAGAALVNYTAHGIQTAWSDPRFNQADVLALSESDRYALAIGNCCLTGKYDYEECLAETWLRAPGRGAYGYIGGSDDTYWDEDYWWAVGATASITPAPTYEGSGPGAYDGLFHAHGEPQAAWFTTSGAVVAAGNLAVSESGSGLAAYYWDVYNLVGDPSLHVHLGVPRANPVAHPGTVLSDETSLAVEADPGTYVGLSQGGRLVAGGEVGEDRLLALAIAPGDLEAGVPLRLVATAQNRRPYAADIDVLVPLAVELAPAAIPAGVPASVTVTVREPDGTTPRPGVAVRAEGLRYATAPALTGADGTAVLSVDYPYGPSLVVTGREPGADHDLLRETLAVTAAALPAADLALSTEVGLEGAYAVGWPGRLTTGVDLPGRRLYVILPDGAIHWTDKDNLVVTPDLPGRVEAVLAVPGYDVHAVDYVAVEATGTLGGQVTGGGSPLAGAEVVGRRADGAVAFSARTDAGGVYTVAEPVPVGDYGTTVTAFGYLAVVESVFVRHGVGVRDFVLEPAASGALEGTVTEPDGTPVAATVKLVRTDVWQVVAETATNPADGSYLLAAVPYFTYELRARAFQHVPLTRPLALDAPHVELDLVMEPTGGNLLVLDDGPAGAAPPRVDPKTGETAAPAAGAPGKGAAALLADELADLEYLVTLESAAATDPSTWGGYDLLVVSCGDNAAPLADADLRAAIRDHVHEGGRLLLEGGDLARVHREDVAFASEVLHIFDWVSDVGGDLFVLDMSHPISSVPNVLERILPCVGASGADRDAVSPALDARAPATWVNEPTTGSIVTFDPNPAPEGGQIVYLACNYAALDTAGRAALLENCAGWLLTPEYGSAGISGRVQLAGEEDHAGVLLRALPGGGSTVTASDGRFAFQGLFAGVYQLVATRDGWSAAAAEIALAEGQQVTDLELVLFPVLVAEGCSEPALAIPDDSGAGCGDAIHIDAAGPVSAVEIQLDITHAYIGDLVVELEAPDGTSVLLANRTGGAADDLRGWYPAELAPAQSLDLLIGVEAGGSWNLYVSDHAAGDEGILNSWCLRVFHADTGPRAAAAGAATAAPRLWPNHPNPFNPSTRVTFDLPRQGPVDLGVYDLDGRRVASLARGRWPAGRHVLVWDGRDDAGRAVASGVYLARLLAAGRQETRKMILLK